MALQAGDFVEHEFAVTARDMELFQALSNDKSAIHVNSEFARARGFRDVIVYGGILLAQLSHVLGGKIPGDKGVSLSWQIDYRKPLYVDERAVLKLKVIHVAESTGSIEGKFEIRTADRLVATGKTHSLLPVEDLRSG
jgi:acyl dehydratase